MTSHHCFVGHHHGNCPRTDWQETSLSVPASNRTAQWSQSASKQTSWLMQSMWLLKEWIHWKLPRTALKPDTYEIVQKETRLKSPSVPSHGQFLICTASHALFLSFLVNLASPASNHLLENFMRDRYPALQLKQRYYTYRYTRKNYTSGRNFIFNGPLPLLASQIVKFSITQPR